MLVSGGRKGSECHVYIWFCDLVFCTVWNFFQWTSSDDLCPAGEFDKQMEPGTGRSRETLSPSSYTSECLGPDTDREWREGKVVSNVALFCLLGSVKAFSVPDAVSILWGEKKTS